jgi:hypothetical protein
LVFCNRLFDLIEARQLRLGAGQPPLQILDAPRLFDDVADWASMRCCKARDLGAVAPVLFVQPGHHLGELCQIHVCILRCHFKEPTTSHESTSGESR